MNFKNLILFYAALTLACEASAQYVRVDSQYITDEEFSSFADAAVKMGATHIQCTQVEPSIWQWNVDRYDPYPCWSILRPTIFKFYVPEALKPYLPADYAQRNLTSLKKKAKIMEEKGLKPVFTSCDPAYLPEAAYRDHPNWRGSRCDQPRRSRYDYYAPCIDDPEMRELFVKAVEEVCKVIPVEQFDVMSNDSGAGLCWDSGLYPGPNGPQHCKNIPTELKVVNYLSVWQEGARRAGVKNPIVNIDRYLRGNLRNSVLPYLKEGQYAMNRNAQGGEGNTQIGWPGYYDYFFPIDQMPYVVKIANQLYEAQKKQAKNIVIGIRGLDEIDAIRYLEKYMKQPVGAHESDVMKSIEWLAGTFVGEENADKLVSVWMNLDKLHTFYTPYETGGHLFRLGTTHQRWLTRPFVVYPERLKDEERQYWREYIFQAGSEDDANCMTMLQGHKWLGGYGAFYIFEKTTANARAYIRSSIATAKKLEDKAVDAESARYLKGLTMKLQLLDVITTNALHAVEFQTIIEDVPEGFGKEDHTEFLRFQGDPRSLRLDQIIRDEVDLSYKLIALLDKAEKEGISILVTMKSDKLENIMHFGPNVRENLRKRITIMNNHRGDVEEYVRTRNH